MKLEFIEPYKITVLVMGLSGMIFFLQLLIADLVGIKRRHIPGYPIEPSHNDLHFRATRTLSNTNESVAVFILLVCFSILSSANANLLNISATVYLVGRIGHMLCYYFNLKLLRSISFVASLLGLVAIFIVGIVEWF
jgi:uncharacterized MAPEG superfamily protein